MFDEAIEELQHEVGLGRSFALAEPGLVYAMAGRKSEANQVLSEIDEGAKCSYVKPTTLALIHLALGESESAIDWFDRAYAERDDRLTYIAVDPLFISFREDSSFEDLLRRMNFPE